MAKSGVSFIGRSDPVFPSLLAEIPDPPVGFYRKGSYAINNPCIAIVGSRRATTYGQSVAKALGAELGKRGYCVVSGLARGIDTAAHEGALSVGGRTVAVLGTGIGIIHPRRTSTSTGASPRAAPSSRSFPFGRGARPRLLRHEEPRHLGL